MASEGKIDPMHQFTVEPLLPLKVGDYDLSFTNSSLWLLIALVVLCSGPAAAQGLGAGVRGGVNLANLTFDAEGGAPSFDPRTGIVAGGFVVLPVFALARFHFA